jgi:hypothetical protein
MLWLVVLAVWWYPPPVDDEYPSQCLRREWISEKLGRRLGTSCQHSTMNA